MELSYELKNAVLTYLYEIENNCCDIRVKSNCDGINYAITTDSKGRLHNDGFKIYCTSVI